jgi:hypothetical protein
VRRRTSTRSSSESGLVKARAFTNPRLSAFQHAQAFARQQVSFLIAEVLNSCSRLAQIVLCDRHSQTIATADLHGE